MENAGRKVGTHIFLAGSDFVASLFARLHGLEQGKEQQGTLSIFLDAAL
jgi:hypothetical protein